MDNLVLSCLAAPGPSLTRRAEPIQAEPWHAAPRSGRLSASINEPCLAGPEHAIPRPAVPSPTQPGIN